MKRIACLMVLMALSSPASARSHSFVVHGHRVYIEAGRHCRSLSCISVSVPGVGTWRNGRRVTDVATADNPAPAPAPATTQAAPIVAPPPAQPVYAPPVAQLTPPPAQPAPPVTRAQTIPPAPPAVQAQPSPRVPAPILAAAPPPPAVGFETPRPQQSKPQQNATPPAPAAEPPKPRQSSDAGKPDVKPQERIEDKPVVQQPAPPVARVTQQTSYDDSPIGDWQTEGKNGLVRIETCGQALCGYMLNATTKAKGEPILVNMKPKPGTASQWTGNVYSRSSGNNYYGTMTLKEGNTLRVEACALGSFFCSGNNWTRFEDGSVQPDATANSRQDSPAPRS
jgi:hypothetical protein